MERLRMELHANMQESGILMKKLGMDIVFSQMEVSTEGTKLKKFFMGKECTGGL